MNEKARMLWASIQSCPEYWQARKQVKEEIVKPKYTTGVDVQHLLEESGEAAKLRALIWKLYQETTTNVSEPPIQDHVSTSHLSSFFRQSFPCPPPPLPLASQFNELDSVVASYHAWSENIKAGIIALARDSSRPLVRLKSGSSKDIADASKVRFVADSQDLFAMLQKVDNKNYSGESRGLMGWGLIRLHLYTPPLAALRKQYVELKPDYRQVGVDKVAWFNSERIQIGTRALNRMMIPHLQQFAKRGLPPSIRRDTWTAVLGVSMDAAARSQFQQLSSDVSTTDFIIDDAVRLDVETACNNDNYFVFEDVIRLVALVFVRDSWLDNQCVSKPQEALLLPVVNGSTQTRQFPPCGFVPLKNFAFLIAPVAFLSEQPHEVYMLFRSLFAKYFCRLFCLSSHPQSIIGLCKLFESLLQTQEPELFYHMIRLDAHPLKFAYPWIMQAFAGYVEAEQVLQLWDRIIAFDSLFVVSILAAAIMSFRAPSLLQVSSAAEVSEVLEDLTFLEVIPLLQNFLFAEQLTT